MELYFVLTGIVLLSIGACSFMIGKHQSSLTLSDLKASKERLSVELSRLKDEHEKYVESTESVIDETKKLLSDQKAEFAQEKEAQDNRYQKLLTEQKAEFAQEKEAQDNRYQKLLSEQKVEFAQEKEAQDNRYQKLLTEQKAEFAKEKEAQDNRYQKLLTDQKAEFAKEKEAQDNRYQKLLTDQKEESAKEKTELCNRYQEQLEDLRNTAATEKAECLENYKQQLAVQNEKLDSSLSAMKESVLNTATRMFEEREKGMLNSNTRSIKDLFSPIESAMAQMTESIDKYKSFNEQKEARFDEQLKTMISMSMEVGSHADKLALALTSNNKTHGDWGEFILEGLLQNCGMTEDVHYMVQQSYTSADGKIQRPDIIVKLPNQRQIVIDSKVSLKAIEDFFSAQSKEDSDRFENENYMSVKSHIDELAKKDYSRLDSKNYSQVLMYIPIDNSFFLAVQHDPSIIQYAMSKGVVMVTSATLMLSIYLIGDLWVKANEDRNIQEIFGIAGQLYEKFATASDSLITTEKLLERAIQSNTSVIKTLTNGKANATKQVLRLTELGAKYNKSKCINKQMLELAEESESDYAEEYSIVDSEPNLICDDIDDLDPAV